MESLKKFGERLTELLLSQELTSDKLGTKIGVSGSSIRRWCNGTLNIKLSKANTLADYFKCSLEFLFGKTEKILDFVLYPSEPFYPQLRRVMKEKGVTRYRLVKDLKKSHGHFYFWEKGGDPSMQTVIDLADYLDCSLDYLTGRERK